VGHYLYLLLDKKFKNCKPGMATLILKMAATNLIVIPILNASFLMAMAIISGQNVKQAIFTTNTRLYSVLKTSWKVFPMAQFIAFRNLPPELLSPFFNIVAFLFGTYFNILAKLEKIKK
jgi:peroxisomal membrane protein 2